MSYPVPTREAHQIFCEVEGWTKRRTARGRTGTHHVNYELDLPDGRILRTRISHPPDRTNYGRSIWAHILRDQLDVGEEEFWNCVQNSVKPDRGVPETPESALPADLVYQLVTKLDLGSEHIASLTQQDAVQLLAEYWSRPEGGLD